MSGDSGVGVVLVKSFPVSVLQANKSPDKFGEGEVQISRTVSGAIPVPVIRKIKLNVKVVKKEMSIVPLLFDKELTSVKVDFKFNAQRIERIRTGFSPMDMDDKWFAYNENDCLYVHRSWSGELIFRCEFIDRKSFFQVQCLDANMKYFDDSTDATHLFKNVIELLF